MKSTLTILTIIFLSAACSTMQPSPPSNDELNRAAQQKVEQEKEKKPTKRSIGVSEDLESKLTVFDIVDAVLVNFIR